MRRLVVGLAALALLAGCGSGSGPRPSAATSHSTPAAASAPTATPTPTPTILTKAQAAALYKRLVAPSNAEMKTMDHYWNGHPTLAKLKVYAKKVAAEDWALAQSLNAQPWPTDVQPAVKKLVASIVNEQQIWTSMIATHSVADFDQASLALNTVSTTPANNVRLALGLKPAG